MKCGVESCKGRAKIVLGHPKFGAFIVCKNCGDKLISKEIEIGEDLK